LHRAGLDLDKILDGFQKGPILTVYKSALRHDQMLRFDTIHAQGHCFRQPKFQGLG